jgi:hypothetical protein
MRLTKPELNEGDIYVGAIINADGTGNHIILLPGDNDDANWQKQMDWAKSIGGDLPTRAEQNLLFEGFREQFQSDWYWSNQQHAEVAGCAWYQCFINGSQHSRNAHYELRARAVRRVAI